MPENTDSPFVTVASIDNCSATVILLYGLGDTPQGFLRVVRKLRDEPVLSHVQYILPAASARLLSAHSSRRATPAWFDLSSFQLPVAIPGPGEEDEDGILQSVASLDALLAELIATGVDPSRIVLGGFSQGAAMSLLTGLTIKTPLAGLAVLSGRLLLRHKLKTMVSPHASSLPIFWGHGTADPIVGHDFGRACANFLISEIGVPAAPETASLAKRILATRLQLAETKPPSTPTGLAFHSYSGLKHEVGTDELGDLVCWLKALLPPLSTSD
ncbi:Phospholipase/Carboxylesterase-domain-containing protein [Mycena crocata]|nr:Phospholipase/Carboxylesterase-domain-containing protein [Mycena crocata]